MKTTTTIVLFASIFAIAVGALGISGDSTTSLMIAAPHENPIGMLGHVEYKVMDSSGNIIKYMQGDNDVVNTGKDCVAFYVFGSAQSTCVFGDTGTPPFTFIAIGNGSSGTLGVLNQTLADAGENDATAGCGVTGTGGEMARKQGVVTSTDATSGGTGTVVVIDTSTIPFSFDVSNATSVIDSGLFNGDYNGGPLTNNVCTGAQAVGTDFEMFSRQLLNGNTGISVSDGDSLSVKWTITVG